MVPYLRSAPRLQHMLYYLQTEKSEFYTQVFDMKGIKIILFGIAVALFGLSLATNNVFACSGTLLGAAIGLIGLCKKD